MSPLIPYGLNLMDLIDSCKAGEKQAQKQLFEMFAGKMMSVSRRYARHRMEAEDIMQDGFIRAFTKLDQYQHGGSFEGWLRRIIINIALKKISKKSFKNENIGIDDNYDLPVAETALSAISADEIMQLVETLPDGYKHVFNLYVMDGYSHKEIGEILGMGESTSRSQLVKARRILQQKIIEIRKIAI